MQFLSVGVQETENAGEAVGRRITGPMVLALRGGLGAGKTAYVRGLARGLGVADQVTSPTYGLVHEHEGRLPLFHFDLYRLGGPEDLFDIGWDDYMARGGVCAVEWSERAQGFLPPDSVVIQIDAHPDNPEWRLITCDDFGA